MQCALKKQFKTHKKAIYILNGMIFKYLTFVLSLLVSLSLQAQKIHHYNVWNKLSVIQPIDTQFIAEVDLQHRTQNNFFATNTPFDKNLLSSARLTIMYQLNKNLGLSLSPFSYFNNNAIIQKPSDIDKPISHEIRFSAGVELQGKLTDRLWLLNKAGVEYRDFDSMANAIRLRNKISLRYELNDKFSATLYEEPLVNISGLPKNHLFDHNRVALLASFKPTKHWRLETGYIHINRLPRNSDKTLQEENLVLNLYYTLNTLIKHKS